MTDKLETGDSQPKSRGDEEELKTATEPENDEFATDGSPEIDVAEQVDLEPSEIMLKHELDEAKAQAEEYLDGWQRARAEFANYKKRMERERAETSARIAGDTLTKYLGVIDDLERALKERPEDGDAAAWAEGIELIYRKMYGILEAEGVDVIPADGAHFDPTLHEAISHEESEDHEEGDVIEVVQPGYRMGDRILRPAVVRVAK